MQLVLLANEENPDDWVSALHQYFPNLTIKKPHDCDPEQVEIAVVGLTPPDFFGKFPNLKLIISLWAGIDRFHRCDNFPYHLPCFRMIDQSLTSRMVEYAALHCLRITLDNPRLERSNLAGVWDYFVPNSAADTKIGIMGAGVIGHAIGKALQNLGFCVKYWANQAKDNLGAPCFNHQQFGEFIRDIHGLLMVLPNTPKLADFMNKERLYQLPKGTWLINIGRGPHIIDADLVDAINDNQISFAVCDVFREEPLPASHIFYNHPKIFITPHIAGVTLTRTAVPYVAEIIQAYIHQQNLPILGRVDWQKGY